MSIIDKLLEIGSWHTSGKLRHAETARKLAAGVSFANNAIQESEPTVRALETLSAVSTSFLNAGAGTQLANIECLAMELDKILAKPDIGMLQAWSGGLKARLDTAVEPLCRNVKTLWEARIHQHLQPHQQLANFLARFPQNAALFAYVGPMRVTCLGMESLLKTAVPKDDDVSKLKQLSSNAERERSGIAGLTPEVVEFLSEVGGGVSLTKVSPDVRDWLKKWGMVDAFLVRLK